MQEFKLLNLSSESTSKVKEIFNIFITANLLVFSLVGFLKLYDYINEVGQPLYFIRTVDGDYYSSNFKHYGHHVTFSHNGETLKKSQKGLKGIVIQKIK